MIFGGDKPEGLPPEAEAFHGAACAAVDALGKYYDGNAAALGVLVVEGVDMDLPLLFAENETTKPVGVAVCAAKGSGATAVLLSRAGLAELLREMVDGAEMFDLGERSDCAPCVCVADAGGAWLMWAKWLHVVKGGDA